MRGKSTLFILLSLALLLAAGGVAAMSLRPSGNGLLNTAAPQEQVPDPMVPIVVAQIDLPQGTLISPPDDFLSIEEVPASQYNTQLQFNNPEALRDMVTTTEIKAGDVIRSNAVRQAGLSQKIPESVEGEPALKAFPIQVNTLSGVADLLQPGDFVDVVGSFRIDVTTLYSNGQGGVSEKTSPETTTKVLLQDVEVLDVLKPAVPAEGEAPAEQAAETPENTNMAGENTPANVLASGNWILVLAVTNEEAEVLRFSLNQGINLTTVLRRAGDHDTEDTPGATLELLTEIYGLPKPRAITIDGASSVPNTPAVPNP